MPGTATAAQCRVWEALSRLYLDNDSRDDDNIAHVLAGSPFTLEQLRTMLLHEVHPVLIGNLRSVAGVWDEFDPDWLAARIQARQAGGGFWSARCTGAVTHTRSGPCWPQRSSRCVQPRRTDANAPQ
ncbi:hypothetical protein XBLMG947_3553 [Xanthomonas bromi]|uniref:DUF7079 domain-containing protein n=1 Tax=Xanthomonas bromi TaxID=56449 RepID=A0A1C3NQU2_9XANT|nr:hypothetical protein XBLMG947_3553 [Xanthomonas bromi]